MAEKKEVLIVFLGNIDYDSRASNLYKSLTERGYKVKVVSFDWLTEGFKSRKGDITIYKLNKGFLSITFYLKFIFLLKINLLETKASIIFAEDIYTLPFAVIFLKLKGAKVFYDSRELYGYLAGLKKRKVIQTILRHVEKIFITKVDKVITTGDMDAEFLTKEYGIKNTLVIRNLPLLTKIDSPFDFRKKYNLSANDKIILYQGVILHGRGLRLIFDIISEINNAVLIIIGGGEHKKYYEDLVVEKGIGNKVYFLGKVNQKELLNFTAGADIGLALIENISLSYYYALPNKMFEYILAGIPVFASSFPQMKNIIDKYNIGAYVDPENREELLSKLKELINDDEKREKLIANCKAASNELNWDKEIEKLFTAKSFLS